MTRPGEDVVGVVDVRVLLQDVGVAALVADVVQRLALRYHVDLLARPRHAPHGAAAPPRRHPAVAAWRRAAEEGAQKDGGVAAVGGRPTAGGGLRF